MNYFDAAVEFLKQQALANNFLSGAVIGGVLLSMLHTVRGYFASVFTFIRNRLYMSLTIHSTDTSYYALGEWLVENKFDKFSRNYRMEYSYVREKVAPLPAPGAYWFFYKGWPIRAYVERDNSPASAGGDHSGGAVKEYMSVSYFGFSNALLMEVMEEVNNRTRERLEKTTGIFVSNAYDWDRKASITCGSNSLCLNPGVLEDIEQDIARFVEAKEWYTKRGVPYQRGYLFYGPPGTGKTSLVRYLATKLDRSIYILNESDYSREDIHLRVQNLPPNSILLLEDVDCFHSKRGDAGEKTKDSFGTGSLLNALGGIVPLEDVLVMMTTNFIDKLDPALIRCGRIDKRVELGYCTEGQIKNLFAKFYEDDGLLVAGAFPERLTPAQVVEAMKQHPASPSDAMAALTSENVPEYISPPALPGKRPRSPKMVADIFAVDRKG